MPRSAFHIKDLSRGSKPKVEMRRHREGLKKEGRKGIADTSEGGDSADMCKCPQGTSGMNGGLCAACQVGNGGRGKQKSPEEGQGDGGKREDTWEVFFGG